MIQSNGVLVSALLVAALASALLSCSDDEASSVPDGSVADSDVVTSDVTTSDVASAGEDGTDFTDGNAIGDVVGGDAPDNEAPGDGIGEVRTGDVQDVPDAAESIEDTAPEDVSTTDAADGDEPTDSSTPRDAEREDTLADDATGRDICEAAICPPIVSMVVVPGGTYWMGCNEALDSACEVDEYPQHAVDLSGYEIDVTEVTVAAFAECVDGSACVAPSDGDCAFGTTTFGKVAHEDHPVTCVSWESARGYCEWAGKRLCTEAEWEKAARGGCEVFAGQACKEAMPVYPWGNEKATCELAVMANDDAWGCGSGAVQQVGTRPDGASPYGVLDMAGNVDEWVEDWWGLTYYADSPASNPGGPAVGSSRVARGGTYGNIAADVRASVRFPASPGTSAGYLGFRCCRTLSP